MTNSLPLCEKCSSPVTDSIEIEIENHGRVKLGKYTRGSWICNDCMTGRIRGEDENLSTISASQDDSNGKHHEGVGVANKSDVSPNTPPADEADL
jgi:hypothetical protein